MNEQVTIVREGFLEKQSRFWKNWKDRWMVLTPTDLMSFKERKQYKSPTEVISLKDIISIKSCDEETHREASFVGYSLIQKIETSETTFYLTASSNT